MAKPKLIAFDLDYTLWPFWIDTHVTPPFRKSNGSIVDSQNSKIKYYPEVPSVLEKLHNEGYVLAVASRTSEIQGAFQLLKLLDWDKYFAYKEIYPGQKTAHFSQFRKKSGFDYQEMLFFDDEHRNIVDLKKVGVTSILVSQGVNKNVVDKGLDQFANEHS